MRETQISSPTFCRTVHTKTGDGSARRLWRAHLRADAVAGLTVAIVALPLSMAIAIASGVGPERGLYTAIIGGFLVSLLGGSRFQVGGPAGAFIVLVAATVARHGVDGMLLATFLSGLMLLAIGYLRLGAYIKFIPYPVTVGFTAGIAVIIFASQIKDFLGLTLGGAEPGPLMEKLPALFEALPTLTPAAVAIGAATVAVIVLTKRLCAKDSRHAGGGVLAAALSLHMRLLRLKQSAPNSARFPAPCPSRRCPPFDRPRSCGSAGCAEFRAAGRD